MKKITMSLIILIYLTSCRSLGSWYKNNPPPVDHINISRAIDKAYFTERVQYKSNIYDLIIINLSYINLEIECSSERKGLSLMDKADSDLIFATNGGMYKEDRRPLGYFSDDGIMISPLNRLDNDYGNFYMKPNGVFFIADGKARILETDEFYTYLQSGNPTPDIATQSGPLLLYKKTIHQDFKKNSSNRFVRNGVGIVECNSEELLVFAISNRPVNFYDFSVFFKDFLLCREALYLDGHISAMYLPELNRYQNRKSLGTVIYALKTSISK